MNPNMKIHLLLLTLCTAAGIVSASAAIPPVFGSETQVRKDELSRAYITPVRIVRLSHPTAVTHAEALLRQGNSQAEMGQQDACVLDNREGESASILLDYGREIHGSLQLVLGSSSRREPSLVRIRFGESVGEADSRTNSLDWQVGYSTDDHAKRDIVLEVPRDGSIEFGNSGFRFVRIDLLQPQTSISLREASAVLRYRDIPYLGSFRSSDERLNKIWMTGAYTVHLNMQEYLWDGIKRDRLIWIGDMHPEVMSISKVFGYNDVVPKSLDLACQQYPLPQWLNGMSAYSMWYLIIQHEWYMQNGDRAFLNKHRDYIVGLIHAIDGLVDADGTERLAEWRFLDWPSSENTAGVEAGYRALISWAMADGEQLCELLGEKSSAALCRDIKKRIDSRVLPHNGLKQAAALQAIAGVWDPRAACDEVIAVGGAKGFSTFYGYYMLEALALAGEYDQAMEMIRTFWGGMLDLGATTFWEDFNMDWVENAARLDEPTPAGKRDIHGDFGAYCYPGYRHSLCHGWASGPTAWLSEQVLGVQIVEAGYRTIRVVPHLGKLAWAEGTVPTPLGVVKVKHTQRPDGSIHTEIDAPKGMKVLRN